MKQLLLTLTFVSITVFANNGLQLTSRHLSTSDGLAGNTINELLQDPDGFIWVATNNGLSRFDGYNTMNYTILQANGQNEAERIGRIVCDTTEQLLWISTSIYENACYDLRKERFVDWTDEAGRQLNKFFLSSRGIVFYDRTFGVRQTAHRQVKDYTHENGLLPSNEVLKILEDNRQRLWILTDKGIVLLLPDGQTKTLLKDTKIIAGDHDKENIYVLSSTGEVMVFDLDLNSKTIGHLSELQKINTSFVWRSQWMIFTVDNTYAIDINNGHTTTLDIGNGRNQGQCNGYHFIANESGKLWIFPQDGDMLSMPLIPYARFASNRGRKFHIVADHRGRLFIATYGNGLFVWVPETGELTHFTAHDEEPLFTTDYLTYALCDQQNNIWLGAEYGGAFCMTQQSGVPRLLKPEPQHKGDWSNAISTIARNPVSDTYTIGTRRGGIYKYTNHEGQMQNDGMLSSRIIASHYDRDNHFWQGTDRGDVYIDGQRWSLSHRINTFCQDANGRMWIGTFGGGLYITSLQDIQRQQFKVFLSDGINKSRIKSLTIDSRGLLIIGTNDGIYTVDSRLADIRESDFHCYNKSNKLFNYNEIYTVFCHHDSIVWVGATGSGLMKCIFPTDNREPHIEQITIQDGLPNNNVYSICADLKDNIWVGTEGGTACVNSKSLLVSHVEREYVAGENAALCSQEGDILLGTTEGLLCISPQYDDPTSEKRENLFRHRPRITDIRVNGSSLQQIDWWENPDFGHEESTFSFYFSDFNYAKTSNSVYQYYLEGFEPDWQPTTSDNRVDYRKLQPGHYTFHLRAYHNGKWTEAETYAFVIRQPWFNTWWAWMIYLTIVMMIVWYVYRNWKEKFDLHQQIKLDRQNMDFRTRLFTNITHEFRTPLAIIKGSLDKLDGKQATVKTAKRGIKRMLNLVNQFMEFRKASTGHLRLRVQQGNIIDFVRDIYQDFWAMAQQKDQQMTFTPSVREYEIFFDSDMVETIVYNLLSNAIKYTPEKGSISLKIRIEDGLFKLECENSGPGISKKQQEALFKPFMNGLTSQGGMGIGLYTSYVMAQTHHGTLRYRPLKADGDGNNPEGSVFTLTLPTTDIYTDEEKMSEEEQTVSPASHDEAPIILQQEVMPETLNDLTVAIIEDDPDMMEQIKHEVGIYFHTDNYLNGQQGYEGVKANPPALLICDVMLPDMNGYEIVSLLKQNASTAQIPIIMLTALADENHQIKAYKAGADDYMIKPCNWRLLVARAIQLIKWNLTQSAVADSQVTSTPSTQVASADMAQKTTLITSQAEKVFMVKLEMLTAQHLSNPDFNIDLLAQLMNIGRTKFYGRVKEMTGLSPNKFIMQARMKKAADLLADGEMNVSEVSYKVGIQDPSYFNKMFKSYYGVVPSKYVKPAE